MENQVEKQVLRAFTVPHHKLSTPQRVATVPLSQPKDDPMVSETPKDADVDDLIEKISTISFTENSKAVSNYQLPPLAIKQFCHPQSQRQLFYLLEDPEFISKLIPQKVLDRDRARIRGLINAVAGLPEYRKKLKDIQIGLWCSTPFTNEMVLCSPIAVILLGNLHEPFPIFNTAFKQLEILLSLSALCDDLTLPEMLPPSGKVTPKEYCANIRRTHEGLILELQNWFASQITQLIAKFPGLREVFWSQVTTPKEGDPLMAWANAVPVAVNIPTTSSPNTISERVLESQVLSQYHRIQSQFTVAYFNLLEAKILNLLGWSPAYPDHIGKSRMYAPMWPGVHSLGTDEYLNDIPKVWRRFFTKSADHSPIGLQKLFLEHQVANAQMASPIHKQHLTETVSEGDLHTVWEFLSLGDNQRTVSAHLSFLCQIVTHNKFTPLNPENLWAALLKSKDQVDQFNRVLEEYKIDLAHAESLKILRASLQIFMHGLMQ
jgi:hypothetical protein